MDQRKLIIAGAILLTLPISYQNCSQVNFAPTPTGNNSGVTQKSLKSIQPVLAVRGGNCIACHGYVGSNVITDFGYGTPNFAAFYSGSRTAFNDVESGWQNLYVSNGSVHVPNISFNASQANSLFGVNSNTTLANILQMKNLGGNSASMVAGVTPPSGESQIVVDSSISIAYPSQTEILALLPPNLQSMKAAVSAIDVPGFPSSQMNGLVADSSGKFIRNSSQTVQCYGDVVVKGPLFLNNLSLQTDENGCRLYVSQTVFIQGPITYVNGAGSNLQITSARAIIIGFSAERLGAIQGTRPSGDPSSVRTSAHTLTTPGGPWPRFQTSFDAQYNPSGKPINGVASQTFFDNIVSDALSIGPELQDAGDAAALANLVPGEMVYSEIGAGAGTYPGNRIAINYTGLLLNAPHIHSRYGGTFQGVIIGDVAMLARNPSSTEQLEQFVFDPIFNSVESVLPALSTNILNVQN